MGLKFLVEMARYHRACRSVVVELPEGRGQAWLERQLDELYELTDEDGWEWDWGSEPSPEQPCIVGSAREEDEVDILLEENGA